MNWLIEYHFERGDYAMCKKIIKNLQERKESQQQEYATFIQGRISCAEGKQNEGLEMFQLCYKLNPNNAENLLNIAQCLISQGRIKKAIEALLHSKQANVRAEFGTCFELAQCYFKLKEFQLAEENCKEAAKICRNEAVYKLLSECLIEQQKIGEAIEVYRVAIRLFPKSSILYTSFGRLCVKMDFEDDALRTLNTAVKLKRPNLIASYELALLHQKRRESWDTSIELYQEIIYNGAKTSVSIYNNIGLCYFQKNKFILALTCLLKARDLNPTSASTLFNLGLVYASLRQYCSAIVYWKAASVFKGSDPEIGALISACLIKLEDKRDNVCE